MKNDSQGATDPRESRLIKGLSEQWKSQESHRFSPTVQKLRQEAFQLFSQRGFHPSLSMLENFPWKIPSLKRMNESAKAITFSDEYKGMIERLKDSSYLVFINGVWQQSLGRLLDPRLQVRPLQEILQGNLLSPAVPSWMMTLQANIYALFNQAFSREGLSLHLPKNVEIDRPVHLLHLTTEDFELGLASTRILMVLETGAKLQLAESTFHLQGPSALLPQNYFASSMTDIELSSGSSIDHYQFQGEGQGAVHLGMTRVKVQRDASFHSLCLQLGAQVSKRNVMVELLAPGARGKVDGLYALRGEQTAEIETFIDHQVGHTESSQLYKGILGGKSHGTFSGKIVVAKAAQKVASSQLNKNLLLNNLAHVTTLPQLQIDADDVKCSHGATVGQLSPDEIFYLNSRGLSTEKARRMLSQGFARDLLLKIPDAELRTWYENLLSQFFQGDLS